MKNSTQIKTTRDGKAMTRLAVGAGLGLWVLFLGATGGDVGQRLATGIQASRASRHFYQQCRAEVKFAISVVNYLLTPIPEPAATNGHAPSDAPRSHNPAPAGGWGGAKGSPSSDSRTC